MEWLKKEAFGFDVIKLIFILFCIEFFYTICVVNIMVYYSDIHTITELKKNIYLLRWYMPFLLFFAALGEELQFRYLPMLFAYFLRLDIKSTLIIAGISSVIFGLLHHGLISIPLQGVCGMFLSVLYLKCGGWQGKMLKPVFASTTMHFLHNGATAIILIAQGRPYF